MGFHWRQELAQIASVTWVLTKVKAKLCLSNCGMSDAGPDLVADAIGNQQTFDLTEITQDVPKPVGTVFRSSLYALLTPTQRGQVRSTAERRDTDPSTAVKVRRKLALVRQNFKEEQMDLLLRVRSKHNRKRLKFQLFCMEFE